MFHHVRVSPSILRRAASVIQKFGRDRHGVYHVRVENGCDGRRIIALHQDFELMLSEPAMPGDQVGSSVTFYFASGREFLLEWGGKPSSRPAPSTFNFKAALGGWSFNGDVVLAYENDSDRVVATWDFNGFVEAIEYGRSKDDAPAHQPTKPSGVGVHSEFFWRSIGQAADVSRGADTSGRESYFKGGVCLSNRGEVCGTDCKRGFVASGFGFRPEEDCVIPAGRVLGCKEIPIGTASDIYVSITESHVRFSQANWSLAIRRIEAKYPNLLALVPAPESASVTFNDADASGFLAFDATIPRPASGDGDERVPVALLDVGFSKDARLCYPKATPVALRFTDGDSLWSGICEFVLNRDDLRWALELGFRHVSVRKGGNGPSIGVCVDTDLTAFFIQVDSPDGHFDISKAKDVLARDYAKPVKKRAAKATEVSPAPLRNAPAYLVVICEPGTNAIIETAIWSSPEWEQSECLNLPTFVAYKVESRDFSQARDLMLWSIADERSRYHWLTKYMRGQLRAELELASQRRMREVITASSSEAPSDGN